MKLDLQLQAAVTVAASIVIGSIQLSLVLSPRAHFA